MYSLTLNPAIDKTIEVEILRVGRLNRIITSRSDASGKGINVSKVIHALDGKSIALGFLGGPNGQFIKSELKKMGIKESFVEIQENTRMNIKVFDRTEKHVTELNEKGPHIEEEELKELKTVLSTQINAGDFLAISGSAPPNLPDSIYKELIEAVPKDVKVVLDADGALLEEGIKARPYMIKPNIHEFQRITGVESTDLNDILNSAETLMKSGPESIFLSMGAQGAIFVGREERYTVDPVDVEIKSSIGAGDALVGGLIFSLSQNKPVEEALKTATASAAASVSMEGTQPGPKDRVLELKSKVKIKEV